MICALFYLSHVILTASHVMLICAFSQCLNWTHNLLINIFIKEIPSLIQFFSSFSFWNIYANQIYIYGRKNKIFMACDGYIFDLKITNIISSPFFPSFFHSYLLNDDHFVVNSNIYTTDNVKGKERRNCGCSRRKHN